MLFCYLFFRKITFNRFSCRFWWRILILKYGTIIRELRVVWIIWGNPPDSPYHPYHRPILRGVDIKFYTKLYHYLGHSITLSGVFYNIIWGYILSINLLFKHIMKAFAESSESFVWGGLLWVVWIIWDNSPDSPYHSILEKSKILRLTLGLVFLLTLN